MSENLLPCTGFASFEQIAEHAAETVGVKRKPRSGLSRDEIDKLLDELCVNADAAYRDHLIKLIEADMDGRAVILPYKPGTTVYRAINACDECLSEADDSKCNHCFEGGVSVVGATYSPLMYFIGEVVYSTREEAEGAAYGHHCPQCDGPSSGLDELCPSCAELFAASDRQEG